MRFAKTRFIPALSLIAQAATLSFVQCASVFASAPFDTSQAPLVDYQPGMILVRFTPQAVASPGFLPIPPANTALTTGLPEVDSVLLLYGLTEVYRRMYLPSDAALVSQFGLDRDFRCVISDSASIDTACAELVALQEVVYAEPNYYLYPAVAPNDSLYSLQWGHANTAQFPPCFPICPDGVNPNQCNCDHDDSSPFRVGQVGFDADVDSAWEYIGNDGVPSIRIAVFDSGIESDHPDLLVASGFNAADSTTNTSPLNTHGTNVAGIIGATKDNGLGIAGIAAGCTIVPVRTKEPIEDGGGHTARTIGNGLCWAIDNNIHIINMSIVTSFDSILQNTIAAAHSVGITMIAAAGNGNRAPIRYPSSDVNIIAVGAASPCGERKRGSSFPNFEDPGTTCDGEYFWGSNYGPGLDLIAPTILPTTSTGGVYLKYFNGTSAATPFVSGVAGLVLSHNPTLNPDKVREILQAGCVDIAEGKGHATTGYDIYTGHGMINAFNSVKLARVSDAPTDLTLGNYSNAQQRVSLAWPDNSLVEDNWVIERKESSDSIWQIVATIGPNETDTVAFDDNTTDGSQSYDYRVLPVGYMSPTGIYSPVRSITTPPRWPDNAGASVVEIVGNCFGGFGALGGGTQQSFGGPGPIPTPEKTDMIIINWSPPAMQALEINHYFYQRMDFPDTTGPFYHDLTSTLDTNCAALYSNYTFRIWSVDTAGDTSLPFIIGTVSTGCWPLCPDSPPFKSVSHVTSTLPYTTELIGAYPNPFNPETKITYSLAHASHVSLTVYNILGQRVVTLIDQNQDAGLHSVIWDSRNASGAQVSSGIYFTRFKTDSFIQSKKMLLLK